MDKKIFSPSTWSLSVLKYRLVTVLETVLLDLIVYGYKHRNIRYLLGIIKDSKAIFKSLLLVHNVPKGQLWIAKPEVHHSAIDKMLDSTTISLLFTVSSTPKDKWLSWHVSLLPSPINLMPIKLLVWTTQGVALGQGDMKGWYYPHSQTQAWINQYVFDNLFELVFFITLCWILLGRAYSL